jgi:transcriptional regulator with XRE-family HTH domain
MKKRETEKIIFFGGNTVIWEEVGKRIRILRHDSMMTQEQFGQLIGISGQYVGRIERGKRKLSVDLIAVICAKMRVTSDYLMFGIVNPWDNIISLSELSQEQINICFDILKRLVKLINTEDGNELLLKELMRQQQA